jgi:hypothetical protein
MYPINSVELWLTVSYILTEISFGIILWQLIQKICIPRTVCTFDLAISNYFSNVELNKPASAVLSNFSIPSFQFQKLPCPAVYCQKSYLKTWYNTTPGKTLLLFDGEIIACCCKKFCSDTYTLSWISLQLSKKSWISLRVGPFKTFSPTNDGVSEN